MAHCDRPAGPSPPQDDYTRDVRDRRDFLRDQTGVSLEHVGQFSFDPGVLPGNVENSPALLRYRSG